MKTFRSIKQWTGWRATVTDHIVGFVPTMGALHDGHLSLVTRSKSQDDLTVVSVFINPKQFDDRADFDAYPTDFGTDLERLEAAGVHAVLLPDETQMYPDNYRYRVSEGNFSRRLCGAHRPGHFDGVLTVVMRLLNLVRPDNVYFGEKDYQQLQLIRDMVEAFFMPVNIIACATVREADGLAMSSRNQQLNETDRVKAASLYSVLKDSGTAQEAREALAAQGFDVDYVEDISHRRLAAARLGGTRLIDNVEI